MAANVRILSEYIAVSYTHLDVYKRQLYAFDDNGKLVYQKTEEGDVLGEEGYTMKVDLEPGDYHLVTW